MLVDDQNVLVCTKSLYVLNDYLLTSSIIVFDFPVTSSALNWSLLCVGENVQRSNGKEGFHIG